MAKQILSLTDTYAIVKIVGAGTETVTLATDLMKPNQVQAKDLAGNLVPYKVGINFVQWCTTGGITITRGGVTVLECVGSPGNFDFSTDFLSTDYTNQDQDIVITVTTGGTILLKLRKQKGYATKIEPEYFGQYDDPTKVGS